MNEPRAAGDRIVLSGMHFEGRHGATEEEREWPQLIELDVELWLDLSLAGRSDELAATVDYGPVIELCRDIVERRSFRLLEALAEALASAIMRATATESVVIRVRKPAVPIDADLDFAGVEIHRGRT
ncbi:MAG: dihydroneopterin aldolase [Chloroflexota bacterium]|nr:dihydroneopterin aldolase [Chloroflexota bacterium]